MVTTTSEKLTPFLWGHEGFVGRYYLDSGGVGTIGVGMTDRSKIFHKWWMERKGHRLRRGDTITKTQASEVLTLMLAQEYSPPVARVAPGAPQHAFDGATHVSYNCGPGSLKWKWAQALSLGNLPLCAKRLLTTAVTAGGRRINGLVKRRRDEAALIEHGDYGVHSEDRPVAHSRSRDSIRQYQEWLITLGFYTGEIDGDAGPLTLGAVKNFQRKNDLKVDGIVGPATRATILRSLDTKVAKKATGVSAGGGAATGAAAGNDAISSPTATAFDVALSSNGIWWAIGMGLTAALLVFLAFLVWRNRGRVLRLGRTPA